MFKRDAMIQVALLVVPIILAFVLALFGDLIVSVLGSSP